jgi:hypothetical protein
MNRFEEWFLKRVIAREVRQGYDHHHKVQGLYGMIRQAWVEEFTEDNHITHDACLREAFEKTQARSAYEYIPAKVSGD